MVVFGVGRGGAGSTASFWGMQGGMALLFWVVQHCCFRGYSMVMVEGMALLGFFGGGGGHDQ